MINVTALTPDNFDAEVTQSDRPVVIEFWTEGCKPCEKLGKVIRQFADQMKVATCSVDDYPEIATKYGVMNIPTLLFFKNGVMVDRAIGYINDIGENEVAAKCKAVLGD